MEIYDDEAFLKFYDKQIYRFDMTSTIKLIMYMPIGLVLILIRGLILIALNILFFLSPSLLKNTYMVRFTSISLGIHTNLMGARTKVTHSNEVQSDVDTFNVYVANHVSCFDYVAIKSFCSQANYFRSAQQRSLRIIETTNNSIWDTIASWFVNILRSDLTSTKKDDDDEQETLKRADNYPLICFPEQIATNGHYGLLKFDSFPFDLDERSSGDATSSVKFSITPACVRLRRPFLPFSVNCYKSNEFLDAFINLFVPINIYDVSLLNRQVKSTGETSDEFAQRVQKLIGAELGIHCTSLTSDEAKSSCETYLRHLRAHSRQRATLNRDTVNTDPSDSAVSRCTDIQQKRNLSIDKLALQVKDILPDVSYGVIQEHIRKSPTLDIDTILTSILDSNQETNQVNTTSNSTSPVVKSQPVRRFMSYEEKKFNLINEARKRYLSKNPHFVL